MKKIRGLHFGPAGIPHASPKLDIFSGLQTTYDLGLDAFEIEFVYGVRMKPDQAKEVGKLAKELGIVLTAHAPYYINLNAKEEYKIENSIKHIVNSAKMLSLADGYSVVFHPGWYLKKPKEQVYQKVKHNLQRVMNILRDEGYDNVWIRPETMEMHSKFGDLDEVIRLSEEIEGVLPCIDFAHLRYREGWNSREKFEYILSQVEDRLGKEALKNMHIHLSGIKLDKKGTHLNLLESDMHWKEVLEVLKDFGVEGVIISESPNLEEDAMMMRDYYRGLRKGRKLSKKD